MSIALYLLGIVSALVVLVVVVELLRRRRLRERHALWWLVAGLLALLIGIFPQILVWAANLIGVEIPTNLIFFVSLAILILVSIQHSAELTDLEGETRTLAEEVAIQELRIRELEERLDARANPRET